MMDKNSRPIDAYCSEDFFSDYLAEHGLPHHIEIGQVLL
jgi:hypothetical protein